LIETKVDLREELEEFECLFEWNEVIHVMIILFIYPSNFEIFIFTIHQSNGIQEIIINENIIL
jgi:hypothetical protein